MADIVLISLMRLRSHANPRRITTAGRTPVPICQSQSNATSDKGTHALVKTTLGAFLFLHTRTVVCQSARALLIRRKKTYRTPGDREQRKQGAWAASSSGPRIPSASLTNSPGVYWPWRTQTVTMTVLTAQHPVCFPTLRVPPEG